jgi:hypothetical protein
MRWQGKEKLSRTTAVAGAVTAAISHELPIAGDPTLIRVEAVVSAINHVGTQKIILQQLLADGTWAAVTGIETAFTTTGVVVVLLNRSHTSVIPLSDRVRVAVTNGNASDSATFSSVRIYRTY